MLPILHEAKENFWDGNKLQEKTVIKFNPTWKMRLFLYASSFDPEFKGKRPAQILNGIGLSHTLLASWRKEFNPYFDEWFEEASLQFRSKGFKKMLEMVGVEKALGGDFQFWKPLAIREGVIENDSIDLNVIPANLGKYNEWDMDTTKKHCNTLLDSLRALEHEGFIPVAESPEGWEQAGDSRGTFEVQQEPLALLEGVGSDGERTLSEDIGDF